MHVKGGLLHGQELQEGCSPRAVLKGSVSEGGDVTSTAPGVCLGSGAH